MAGAAAPEGEEEDADQDEGKAEADPEAESSPVPAETEIRAEREAQEPVGGEVAEHRSAGVAGAAKGAGGDSLDAIEELEGGACGEESDGGVDDGFVGGIETGDVAREDEKDDAHAGHEGGAKEDRGVACIARSDGIAPAEGLADANGRSGSEAEGNHVGEGDGVQGDLMSGLGHGTESRNQGSYEGEDADLGGLLKGGGKAEGDELADAIQVGLDRSLE